MSALAALRALYKQPGELLIRQWNWKSAILSSTFRAMIFLVANLSAGWHAAAGAMLAEFGYRGITSGFYGAITQAFRQAEPPWVAGAVTAVLLPLCSHSIELALHLFRGTPRILPSIISSVCFTVLSTTFNLYAMRRGVLIVCPGAGSLGADFRRIPRLLVAFIAAGPLAVSRRVCSRPKIVSGLQ